MSVHSHNVVPEYSKFQDWLSKDEASLSDWHKVTLGCNGAFVNKVFDWCDTHVPNSWTAIHTPVAGYMLYFEDYSDAVQVGIMFGGDHS